MPNPGSAIGIDSLIAINSLSLTAFPVYGNATNKGFDSFFFLGTPAVLTAQ